MFSVTGPAGDELIMCDDFYGLAAVACCYWKLPVKDEEPPVSRQFGWVAVSYSCLSSAVVEFWEVSL